MGDLVVRVFRTNGRREARASLEQSLSRSSRLSTGVLGGGFGGEAPPGSSTMGIEFLGDAGGVDGEAEGPSDLRKLNILVQ